MSKSYYILFIVSFIVHSCMFSDCIKKNISNKEKVFFKPYKMGKKWIYKSNMNKTDTLTVIHLTNGYTPCNRLEVSDYQFEWIKVSLKSNIYGKFIYANYTVSEEDKVEYSFNFIDVYGYYYDDEIKKCLDTIKIKSFSDSLAVYTFNHHNASIEKNKFIVSFSWSKKYGIIRYETREGEIFELVK